MQCSRGIKNKYPEMKPVCAAVNGTIAPTNASQNSTGDVFVTLSVLCSLFFLFFSLDISHHKKKDLLGLTYIERIGSGGVPWRELHLNQEAHRCGMLPLTHSRLNSSPLCPTC